VLLSREKEKEAKNLKYHACRWSSDSWNFAREEEKVALYRVSLDKG
jgi:hypothetical protein